MTKKTHSHTGVFTKVGQNQQFSHCFKLKNYYNDTINLMTYKCRYFSPQSHSNRTCKIAEGSFFSLVIYVMNDRLVKTRVCHSLFKIYMNSKHRLCFFNFNEKYKETASARGLQCDSNETCPGTVVPFSP